MHYASITERLADLGSGKWAVHLAARERIASGEPIIELTIGEPDVPVDPALVAACTDAMTAGRTRYSSGRGEPELLAVLAEKYSERAGRRVTPENVLCFPGTQTALFAVMLTLTEAGDDVLVGDPFYATYEGIIRASGAGMRTVPLRAEAGFRMQAKDLEAAITPECRVLLLNSPHNPTGAVLSAEDVAAIGAVCEKHDLWIVCDEVYEELVFEGEAASPFDDPRFAERAIAVSSISKSHAAPGFRSGWAIGPAEFCRRALPVSETMLFGNQPFIADMTTAALSNDPGTSRGMRKAYRRRARLIEEALREAPGLRPLPPAAGMFILLDVSPTGLAGADFALALLDEAGVAVMPGSSFGDNAEAYVRLSLTVPDETLREACRRIGDFAASLMANGIAAHG
ncbi:pyridoxal phosphate-dependent aminotransferase [Pararhizobium mangrovi]|uniref:aspartate transaminase n=1 Tax=Pararhizobium mangrovi TaxID=2590452 RepID=A0A506UA24_9HYPH|nr:pyridoxal phosphate-dependent aminotransferase [Pararhizobium mangrovi]TPW29914.1 pyridoxal phosphate-dependent aminotransferase [Pararhizobium mangrovi]